MSDDDFDSSMSGGDPADNAPVQSRLPASGQSDALGMDSDEESDFMKNLDLQRELHQLLTGAEVPLACANSTLERIVDEIKQGKPSEKTKAVRSMEWLQVFKGLHLSTIPSRLMAPWSPDSSTSVPQSMATLLGPESALNKVIGERDVSVLVRLTPLTLDGYPLDRHTTEILREVFKESKDESILSLILTLIAALKPAPRFCACCTKANQENFKIFPMGGTLMEKDKKTQHDCPYCKFCFAERDESLVLKNECRVHRT
ncbi:hypothetical protein THAOC_35681 [Thalassiosira oceanica]|uniref:Uncharacterized protein n=1 Tax=Thalassiosira oceanica TaxID=159749 RepID=K0R0K4_THAOC|nr:hypothetical protein THAOC_35681 [Thalassiosira oceanica]|eukprot:EJK45693.1 hypothetical protein THAOC_35681 [Thalassiosira oceanica]